MKAFILVFLCLAVSTNAWWGSSSKKRPSYKKLYVTFKEFNRLPVTEDDAKAKGWNLTKSCSVSNAFAGNRYVLKGDTAVMLLMDDKRLLAGIQMGIPKSKVAPKKAPWVSEDNMYVITAYFREPRTICRKGNKHRRHAEKVYGNSLLIQNGPSVSDTSKIPFLEKNLEGTKWVKGGCFPGMGRHYWYGISKNMDCDDFYPVFLLYNGGKLNGFGWNTFGDIKSSRYEYPPKDKLSYFFKKETQPACLDKRGKITTQHIYLDWPYNNVCFAGGK